MRQEPEIIVKGWSERYAAEIPKLIGREGGFNDIAADRGGATKYGISLRYLKSAGRFDMDQDGFKDFDLDFDGDIDGIDIRMLTRGDAKYLYHKDFWLALDCESFPKPIGEMLFDQGVNGGNRAARKLLQRAINECLDLKSPLADRLIVDGQIGPATRAKMDWIIGHPVIGLDALVEAFREVVRERYRAIVARNPSQKIFLRGWLNRADKLGVE